MAELSTLGLPAGLPSNDILTLIPTGESGPPGLTGLPVIAGADNRSKGKDFSADSFARYVSREMNRAEPHVMAQREKNKEADRFMHSHQLSEVDEAALKAQQRPNTVINEVQKFIKFASGIERRSPVALMFVARTMEDQEAQVKGECLFGDTLIRAGTIRRSYERIYDGPVVHLELSNGRKLSGTPNHPILTVWGWKKLGHLQEGDDLIDASLLDRLGVHHYFDHTESRIEERARAIESGFAPLRVSSAANDFHGDGAYSDVNIIRSNRTLDDACVTFFLQRMKDHAMRLASKSSDTFSRERSLKWTAKVALRFAQFKRQFLGLTARSLGFQIPQFLCDDGLASTQFGGDFICRKSLVTPVEQRVAIHPRDVTTAFPVPFACATHRISCFPKPITYSAGMKSGDLADFDRRSILAEIESGEIASSDLGFVKPTVRVTKATCVHNRAPVFNLETQEGFYIASGIIAHNCETKKYEWFLDQSQGSFERSLAFEDLCINGMAFMDFGLSRITDPQGAPRANRCDPNSFWWPKTDKQNLGLGTSSPPRWLGRETHMDVDEAIRKWPDYTLYLRTAAGEGSSGDQFPDFGYGAKKPIPYVVPWIMTAPLNKQGGGGDEAKPGKVPILEWQFYEDQPGFFFFDPVYQDAAWLNRPDFFKYQRYLQGAFKTRISDYDEQDHRVYKRAYLLQRRIVLQPPKELTGLTRDIGYTWNVMTCTWDRSDSVFYGLLRPLMAPQRYTNAMFRQVLEIMGSSAKGGYLMEVGAVTPAQKRDIEDNGARPGHIGVVQSGAISGGRILPKPIPVLPQGSMEVLQFCMGVMEQLIGLSTSLLGNDQNNTPGVSLRRRFTAGMVLLAPLFDALSRFRKREGYLVSEFMRLLSDDRVVRIGGQFDSQALKLIKMPDALRYDIVLDENDQDPNLRQYYTDQITAIAPILIRTGNFFPELLDYINLPAQFRQKLKQGMAQAEQQKMQMAQQGLVAAGGRGKPRGLQEIQADVQVKQARAAKDQAQALATQRGIGRENLKAIYDMQAESRKQGHDEKTASLEQLIQLFSVLKPEAPRESA